MPTLKEHRLLAEAWADDEDGVPIWFLLFGSDNDELAELEIQRADGQPLVKRPAPDKTCSD